MYVVCKLTESVEIMQILGMSKGLFTLNPDSNRFSNRIAQCEFNANPMRINRVIRVHTALCGTEFTRAC